MSNMTVERLAELGRERRISPMFEQAWMRSGGSSPVATAMQIVENRRRNMNRKCLTIAMLLIFFALCLAVAGIVAYKNGNIWVLSGSVVIGVLLIAVFLVISVARESKGKDVNDSAESQAIYFCEELHLAIEWAGYGSSGFYLYRDENEIKEVGTTILVDSAIDILRSQHSEKEADTQEGKESCQVSAGREMARLSQRYDTLWQLGMVTGGYDKYFETARRKIDTDSSPIR